MRRRARIDDNQPELVKQIRKLGVSVFVTSSLGNGYPDLAIGWRGKTHLLEIKNPKKSPSRRKLTSEEDEFFKTWKGSVHKVESIEDVLKIINS